MLDHKLIQNLSEGDILEEVINSSQELSYSELNEAYFTYSQLQGTDITEGVVETPDSIITLMIELVLSRNEMAFKTARWYDPCSGSGKFVVKILVLALDNLAKIVNEESLPDITFNEISKYGFYISLLNIKQILALHGLSLKKYIALGLLKPMLGDALAISAETQDMWSQNVISADVIIGNPPYVRATRLTNEYKLKLKHLYPSIYNGGEDLYSYFYANALNVAKEGGVVCFISPSSFLKKTSSKLLRRYLLDKSSPSCIIDLDENKLFEHASLHAIICHLRRTKNIDSVDYFHVENKKQLKLLFDNKVAFGKLPIQNFTPEGWQLENHSILSSNTIRLRDMGLKVRSGVRPSIRSAYVYEANELDILPKELVKPALQAKSIRKWSNTKPSNDLLFLTKETSSFHCEAEHLLLPYISKLKKEIEVKGNESWKLLRACSYYKEMHKEKIVFPDIASSPRFSLDISSSYVLDGAFFINSNDKCLLGVLNSDLAWQYFKSTCTSIGNASNKGRLRLKKSHIESFPLPVGFEKTTELRRRIENTMDKILLLGESEELVNSLNQYVAEMYS